MPSKTLLNQLQLAAQAFLARRWHYGISNFRHPLRVDVWSACLRTRTDIPTATTPLECSELFQWAKALEKVPGDMAEVGTYLGGTAGLMLRASSKHLHVFDTFEGLPISEGRFDKGEWKGGLEAVQHNLRHWNGRVDYHVGMFPASAKGIEASFSFVHLDLDLYEGTRSALEWFWPRLAAGGAILSHDYPLSDGVVRAFQGFFDGRPETFVPLSGNQCVAVKVADSIAISYPHGQ